MTSTNILLLCGGDGTEHNVSLVSANYVETELKKNPCFSVEKIIIHKEGKWINNNNEPASIDFDHILHTGNKNIHIDCAIPCIHGIPGETGTIQSFLEIINLPYIGCNPESSALCFNKVSTKLWFESVGIPNTPFTFLDNYNAENLKKAHNFFKLNKSVFVKAASQGSSVGCYKTTKEENLDLDIKNAFKYSNDVLIEKTVHPRELETAAYEYNGKLIITNPGEIITPDNAFYTFEEKYNKDSGSITKVEANLSEEIKNQIREYAARAFKLLNLRHLARIDFFYTKEEGILLNEINTFPGMTPISMFPKMLTNHGEIMSDFLTQCINNAINKNY